MGGTTPRIPAQPGAIPAAAQGSNPVTLRPGGPIPATALKPIQPMEPTTPTPQPGASIAPRAPVIGPMNPLANQQQQLGANLINNPWFHNLGQNLLGKANGF